MSTNGTTNGTYNGSVDNIDSPEYEAFMGPVALYETWEDLDQDERLDRILTDYAASEWVDQPWVNTIAHFRHDLLKWAKIKAKYKEIAGNPWDLEKAVDYWIAQQLPTPPDDLPATRNGHVPGPEPDDPFECPQLPSYAAVDKHAAQHASRFLDEYIAFSRTWAPEAYEGFHEAVGLWVLATAAARRVRIEFGRGEYTSLYITLAARTSLFTKTTAANLGIKVLKYAGLGYLLADDNTTPQALILAMTGELSKRYDMMDAIQRQREQYRLAFAAQRGWFYEEYGENIQAMMNPNGPMAGFRGLFRRMDDHADSFTYSTVGRGRDEVHKPYLSLLANVTIDDLQPFIKRQSALWGDGFMARFAFVTPTDAACKDAEFPREAFDVPSYLLTPLHAWHERLGIPYCQITTNTSTRSDRKDNYTVHRTNANGEVAFPETAYQLHDDVWDSYYTYRRALRALIKQSEDTYLDGNYTRFPAKALRIAALLASLHDTTNQHMIMPEHWARAQRITERWRRDLHRLIKQVHTVKRKPTVKRELEEKLLRTIRKHGVQTATSLQKFHKAHDLGEITGVLSTLVGAGALIMGKTRKHTDSYSIPH